MIDQAKDTEAICSWMEPNHEEIRLDDVQWHSVRFALASHEPTFGLRRLDLDALWEVEDRLTTPQREHYMQHVASLDGLQGKFYDDAWVFLHATAEQKIKALAAVIREARA